MASIDPRINKDGDVISYRIRVSRGRGLKPYTMTWPENGEAIPSGWSKRKVEKEVERIASLFEEECRKGNVSTEHKTFAEYGTYVIDLKERTTAKHRTIVRYRDLFDRICDDSCNGIGHIKLQDLRADHLNRLYATLGHKGMNKKTGEALSEKTILEHHRLISTILAQAVKEGLIPQNIAERATPPRPIKHEAEHLEIEQVQTILDVLKQESLEWQAIIRLMIDTGCRRGECIGLRWKDVDLNANSIYICNTTLYATDIGIYHDTTKTGESRHVSISPSVVAVLKAWKNEQAALKLKAGNAKWNSEGYVFTQANGEVMSPDSVTHYCRVTLSNKCGFDVHPHMFRHTQASILINAGVDITTVSKRLGHQQVSTTMNIYSHVLQKADERASGILDELLYSKEA